MIRFLLFLGILLFLFNQITPYLYRLLPNDYVRTRLIWSTLNNPEERPDLVILGNSRGMSGVNGYKLEAELRGNPCVYNLTSTGQRLSESALYYSYLPSSVQVVVQCVDLDQLRGPIELDDPNRVALHMYGYKMDGFTRELLPALEKPLSEPNLYYNYVARNCLFSGLTTYLRKRKVEEQNEENKFEAYQITPEWKRLIERSSVYFRDRGIIYCLVVMPYNPDITAFTVAEKQRALRMFTQMFDSILIVDCMDLLDTSDFYDAIHPNRKGAEKITDQIIRSLRSSGFSF